MRLCLKNALRLTAVHNTYLVQVKQDVLSCISENRGIELSTLPWQSPASRPAGDTSSGWISATPRKGLSWFLQQTQPALRLHTINTHARVAGRNKNRLIFVIDHRERKYPYNFYTPPPSITTSFYLVINNDEESLIANNLSKKACLSSWQQFFLDHYYIVGTQNPLPLKRTVYRYTVWVCSLIFAMNTS